MERTPADYAFLSAHDDDPFARYEAMQELMSGWLVRRAGGKDAGSPDAIVEAVRRTLDNQALDDAFKAETIALPADTIIVDRIGHDVDPLAVVDARKSLKRFVMEGVGAGRWRDLFTSLGGGAFDLSPEAKGRRRLRAAALGYLFAAPDDAAYELAAAAYADADNMTDRVNALGLLANSDAPQREDVLADFHQRFAADANVIDKWFIVQAMSESGDPLARAEALMAHKDYKSSNPNRFRALVGGFAANMPALHREDGAGYRFLADRIIEADGINPQTAARFVAPLGRWRRFTSAHADMMRGELERILAKPGLSKDVREMAGKSLA